MHTKHGEDLVVCSQIIGHGGSKQDTLKFEDRIEFKDDHGVKTFCSNNVKQFNFSKNKNVRVNGGMPQKTQTMSKSGLNVTTKRSGKARKSSNVVTINRSTLGSTVRRNTN